ncbi:MAG: Re/Si-specific NAD(P)(+) transhydrogenase subunit alpha [Saprospiraceae bacterium]|nr:Re/Si-specific NAD(P)(+) transhydrogenase subunit alpha [Saprospiraceae bacterium]
MILGILNEDDQRVAIVPQLIKKFQKLGFEIWIENGAGDAAFYFDADFEAASGKVTTKNEILANSDVLVTYHPPSDEELKALKSQALVVSMFAPYIDDSIIEHLKQFDIIPFSLDMIPRTTIAQSMDVLSSMASVAGYRAVLEAANYLPRYFPMLITAAGSIKPCSVVVLGAGVAGLQAIATAKRLGAVVEASDPRAAAREEVLSLGGKFIEVEGAKDDTAAGGYAVEQSKAFLAKQAELVQERAAKADIIITTAQVRGRKSPILLPTSTVEKMKKGSVIIDIAASTGGNCELTQDGKVVVHNGVTIIGDSNLAAKMPTDASFLFANNIHNYLKIMVKDGQINLDWENEIIAKSCIKPNK